MSSPLYQQFQPQNNLLSMLNQLKQNPVGVLSRRYNIPQDISQEQVNRIMQMKNNPQIQQLLK